MKSFGNQKQKSFLDKIPQKSLDDCYGTVVNLSTFNFSYFDNSQEAGQDFKDWSEEQLVKLLNKLKEYSKKSLEEWKRTKVGSGKHRYNILEEYGDFPKRTDFEHPKHIPHQVSWARFRLEQSVRLIGFLIPEEYTNVPYNLDRKTFYVVFLDKDHRFYKTR